MLKRNLKNYWIMEKAIIKGAIYPADYKIMLYCEDEFYKEKGVNPKWNAWTDIVGDTIEMAFIVNEEGCVDAASVAHEVIHAKNHTFRLAGHIQNDVEDEPEAYLVQWITQKIYDIIKRKNYNIEI